MKLCSKGVFIFCQVSPERALLPLTQHWRSCCPAIATTCSEQSSAKMIHLSGLKLPGENFVMRIGETSLGMIWIVTLSWVSDLCSLRTERLSACVDFPMSLYWRDLARLYPRAKVLLTVRDSAWKSSIRRFVITEKAPTRAGTDTSTVHYGGYGDKLSKWPLSMCNRYTDA